MSKPLTAKPASTASRRRPESGGYPRGDETRAGIIEAALTVFGSAGFDGASTRAIAGRAGVTLPVLAYHFGDKAGLYRACAEHITARISVGLGPALTGVERTLSRADATREEIVALLTGILGAFVNLLSETSETRNWIGFIVREQASPTAAFDTIYHGIMAKVIGTCAAIIGRLLGLPADAEEVRLRALTCLGQVLMFRMARAAVLRTMGWREMDGENLAAVRAAVRAQVEAAFR